jgi:hypothetical protein
MKKGFFIRTPREGFTVCPEGRHGIALADWNIIALADWNIIALADWNIVALADWKGIALSVCHDKSPVGFLLPISS